MNETSRPESGEYITPKITPRALFLALLYLLQPLLRQTLKIGIRVHGYFSSTTSQLRTCTTFELHWSFTYRTRSATVLLLSTTHCAGLHRSSHTLPCTNISWQPANFPAYDTTSPSCHTYMSARKALYEVRRRDSEDRRGKPPWVMTSMHG